VHILNIFGPVWDASGVRGFFGEGYWFHRFVPGLSFEGSTFVAKTMTTYPNEGNMLLREDFSPARLFPDCIDFDLVDGFTLNSVGLSGPGIEALLSTGRWSGIQDPFLISWMPIGKQLEDQIEEAEEFVRILRDYGPFLPSRQVGIQLNVSCPNVGADLSAVVEKAHTMLSILKILGMPIVVKINLLVSAHAAAVIAQHPACAGLCMTNTVPFGQFLPKELWDEYFPDGSPLLKRNEKYNGGGLSGPLLLKCVEDWLKGFRLIDKETYVNAGGGVWCADHVNVLRAAGANSIFIGSVAMHRPWRVRSIIRRAHVVFA